MYVWLELLPWFRAPRRVAHAALELRTLAPTRPAVSVCTVSCPSASEEVGYKFKPKSPARYAGLLKGRSTSESSGPRPVSAFLCMPQGSSRALSSCTGIDAAHALTRIYRLGCGSLRGGFPSPRPSKPTPGPFPLTPHTNAAVAAQVTNVPVSLNHWREQHPPSASVLRGWLEERASHELSRFGSIPGKG